MGKALKRSFGSNASSSKGDTQPEVVDLTVAESVTPPQVAKRKSRNLNSLEREAWHEVVDLTSDKYATPSRAANRKSMRDSTERQTQHEVVDLTIDKRVMPPRVVKAISPNPSSSQHDTQSQVVDLPKSKNVTTPQVARLKSPERRCSERLKSIPEEKRPYYGSDSRKLSNSTKDQVSSDRSSDKSRKRQLDPCEDDVARKKRLIDKFTQGSVINVAVNDAKAGGSENEMSIGSVRPADDSTEFLEIEDGAYLKWTNYERFVADSINEKASAKVKETVRAFNKHYLHFVQEEEKRCKDKKKGSLAKRPSKRPDLKAISEMLTKKETLYPEKRFGHIPGVFVGHEFFSRAEMVAVGFHGHWLNGIDYIGKFCGKLEKHKGYAAPLAVAIVLSGQYEDDVDDLNEVVYTGQGGNDLLGNKHQVKDQVMLRGNLALKNNMEQSIPVRVIRGHKCAESYSGKVYTYCGLYKVVNHWAEKGVSGFTIFKYRLMRLLGQPKLNVDQVIFERGKGPKGSSNLLGLICEDISFGEEVLPIPVTNVVDLATAPSGFRYTNTIQVASTVTIPPSAPGCKCKGSCYDSKTCSCARLNGSDFPYVEKDGGRLVEPRDVVYECGPRCGCGPDCVNRASQRQLKYRLEVYRTENKGWAVRSWDFIPSGAPVCEYIGVLRRNDDLDNVSENDFIFEIDCLHTMHGLEGRERRQSSSKRMKVDHKLAESESEFCVDGATCGNVSRFINHSCDPNLFVQCVLSSHHDIRFARIVLFAADNIPPMQELTYDYGYAPNSVVGPDGKLKHKPCYCGTRECRGQLY